MSRKYEGQSDDAGVMSMLRWGDGDGEQEGREEEQEGNGPIDSRAIMTMIILSDNIASYLK